MLAILSNGGSWDWEMLLSALKNFLNMTSSSTGNSHKVIVKTSETVENLHLHNNSNDVDL